jgi:hypothetical protein
MHWYFVSSEHDASSSTVEQGVVSNESRSYDCQGAVNAMNDACKNTSNTVVATLNVNNNHELNLVNELRSRHAMFFYRSLENVIVTIRYFICFDVVFSAPCMTYLTELAQYYLHIEKNIYLLLICYQTFSLFEGLFWLNKVLLCLLN